jgi:hypothetical protein
MPGIWAPGHSRATKGRNNPQQSLALGHRLSVETIMADREKISTGPNEEAINETIAGTGPGIPDDALAPGEDLPEAPSDEMVEEAAEALGAPTAKRDTLPLDGE